MGAISLTREAFDGRGVDVLIGAGCSSDTTVASQVAEASSVPIVTPSATSPMLSDGRAYPYLVRAIPSDGFSGMIMIDLLLKLWNYTSVALVHSTDAYGAGGADAVAQAARMTGLTIRTTLSFHLGASDFSVQQHDLLQAGSRIIILFSQRTEGTRFMRGALEVGVGGEGFLWLGSDVFADSGVWTDDAALASDAALRERLLTGFFSIIANGQPESSVHYRGYLERRSRLPTFGGEGDAPCSMEMDDEGGLLWALDHDDNVSTPLACAARDVHKDGPFDSFGYDAVFAIAHALHDLIEVQGRTEVVGSELLDTLIKRVAFEGVT
eukprot:6920428-Prymnesium_polylepis.1